MPTITGTAGNDNLIGTDTTDVISGLGGDDIIVATPGNDRYDGGDGFDTVDYSVSHEGLVVDLSITGTQDVVNNNLFETLTSIEGVIGSRQGDILKGAAGQNAIYGALGDDTITDPGGTNYLRGDDGADFIVGGPDFDDINGNMGNDTCVSGGGDDWEVGGKDNDSLVGSAGQNLVYGNLGNDTCDGGDGFDIVRGGQDNDVVNGGAGDDFVSGDRGDDTMTGGAGADSFHTFGEAGIDRVLDFSRSAGDRVQLDPGTVFTVSQIGADTVIDMTGGGRMILVDVQMSTLTPGWIFGA
ncbi:MAG TPA: calcium-binding protein [Phenylobacterium sp.]